MTPPRAFDPQRIVWTLRRRAADWLPRVTVAILVLVALFWIVALAPLQREVDEAQARQRTQRDGQLRNADIDRAGDPKERLSRFYSYFAGPEALAGQLTRLHALARESGLEFRRAEYRMTAAGEQRLARYQIVIPVEGSYRAIRRFAARTLEEMPAFALSQVKFQRKRISEGTAEAQIIFTMYLKP
jgi:Tfp pilus assembly protein PilO